MELDQKSISLLIYGLSDEVLTIKLAPKMDYIVAN